MWCFLVVTALGLTPARVHAQLTGAAINVNTDPLATKLVDANGNSVTHSYISDQPYWVNLAECRAGWQYQISLTDVGIGSTTLEVWAGSTGSDCSQPLSRFGANPVCWRVAIGGVNDGPYTINIPVQRVVAQNTFVNSDVNVVSSTNVPTANDTDCTRVAQGNTQEAGIPINLNFYIFLGGTSNGTPTYSAVWGNAGFDLVGPAAPTTVTLRPADGETYVNFSQVVVTDLSGYKIYCEDQTTTDAGVVLDAGLVDGGVADCSNAAKTMTSGCLPPTGMAPSDIIADKLATSGIARTPNNGHPYACGVASFDTRQNDGVLSTLATTTPWYVDDFFSIYRRSGGKAGGGFCSVQPHRPSSSGMLALAALALFVIRRRRRSAC